MKLFITNLCTPFFHKIQVQEILPLMTQVHKIQVQEIPPLMTFSYPLLICKTIFQHSQLTTNGFSKQVGLRVSDWSQHYSQKLLHYSIISHEQEIMLFKIQITHRNILYLIVFLCLFRPSVHFCLSLSDLSVFGDS